MRAEQSQIDSLIADGVPIVIAEKEVLQTDHAEIGALILAKWSFPDEIVNAVRWHHYPEGSENSNLYPGIVYLANLMCQPNSSSESGEEHNLPYPSVLEKLHLEPEHYDAFAKKARDWMEKMSDTLTFD